MRDTCVIVRLTKSRDPDPATGKPVSTSTEIYRGACEYVAAETVVEDVASGGRSLAIQSATIKLPVLGSGSVAVGDQATVTLELDPGAPFTVRVSGLHRATYAVSRRLPVEEGTSG